MCFPHKAHAGHTGTKSKQKNKKKTRIPEEEEEEEEAEQNCWPTERDLAGAREEKRNLCLPAPEVIP